jgi:hypothetical protein
MPEYMVRHEAASATGAAVVTAASSASSGWNAPRVGRNVATTETDTKTEKHFFMGTGEKIDKKDPI